jgi:DNA-binding NarL/FixJ family response regulator
LFRNTFTYKGHRFEVKHWSVKIQEGLIRKTISLRSANRDQAAIEACRRYEQIVNHGWESLSGRQNRAGLELGYSTGSVDTAGPNRVDAQYWSQRLIHRKYTEAFSANGNRELSVRIDHAGTSHYFPLGTYKRKLATDRAVQIYHGITGEGWDAANTRFARELSIAFRWLDDPVAWTYTTIHTRINTGWTSPRPGSSKPDAGLDVAIAESDPGIRQALAWCINQQAGFRCNTTFANASIALKETPRQNIHLLLVNQSLSDLAGTVCLEQLRPIAPKVAGLIFSVYEDCDQLFKCAPGGAASYVFRRTLPVRILEPIADAAGKQFLSRENIADRIRSYFQVTVAALPAGTLAQALTTLTQREHEILGLLSKGQPDKEIADLLRISTWTVHGHLKKIFEKLGVHNRTEAVLTYLHK